MILHVDADIVVVAKPSGLIVHRGLGHDRHTLHREIAARVDGPLHAVHRLDRGTSGVLVFARSREAARHLAEQLAAGSVQKHYLALVRGRAPESGRIDHPVPSDPGGPRVAAVTSFVRRAVLDIEPRTCSVLDVQPETGRFHQIRRHLKHIDHPVIGDANYGKGALNRALAERYGLTRLALHAGRLTFVHPGTGEAVTFEAPLPKDLAEPLARMGFVP